MSEGILGRKLGMTQIFDMQGQAIPVTIIEAGPCLVLRKKTEKTDGYTAVQLGYGSIREKLLTKPQLGEFHKRQQEPKRYRREFRVTPEQLEHYTEGQEVKVNLFKVGEKIDVCGTSKGTGFTGVVKRYHFKGGSNTHGVHEYYRHGGSIGTNSTPGRVAKGRKMPGQSGNARTRTQNLSIIRVELGRNLIMVKGAVPGARNQLVLLYKASKGSAQP